MKRTTIAAFCIAGFIGGCSAPPHTLVAVEASGPYFWELRNYGTKAECEKAAATEPLTDAVAYCIQKGTN